MEQSQPPLLISQPKVEPQNADATTENADGTSRAITGGVCFNDLETTTTTATITSPPVATNTSTNLVAAAAAAAPAITTTNSQQRKRPYRRTRRPEGYNDKSSITTTTQILFTQPLNVYDAILNEANDLYYAAFEAQQLGRYKISSTYLLLLHTRLVGLGKRFDKSNILLLHPPPMSLQHHPAATTNQQQHLHHQHQHHQHQHQHPADQNPRKRQHIVTTTGTTTNNTKARASATSSSSSTNNNTNNTKNKTNPIQDVVEVETVAAKKLISAPLSDQHVNNTTSTSTSTTTTSSSIIVEQASSSTSSLPQHPLQQQQRSPKKPTATSSSSVVLTAAAAAPTLLQLPSNIEVDTDMIEHLARAAVELHAARRAASASGAKLPSTHSALSPSRLTKRSTAGMLSSSISSPHRNTYHQAAAHNSPRFLRGGTHTTISDSFHQSPNVRTFLASTANQQGVTNAATETGVAQSIVITTTTKDRNINNNHHHHHSDEFSNTETTMAGTNSTDTTTQSTTLQHQVKPSIKNQIRSPTRPTTGTNIVTQNNHNNNNHIGSRKPVTTAINTVPYANCNARLLLQKGGAPMIIAPSKTINQSSGQTFTTTKITNKADEEVMTGATTTTTQAPSAPDDHDD